MQTQKPTINLLQYHLIRKDLLKTMVKFLKHKFFNHLEIEERGRINDITWKK